MAQLSDDCFAFGGPMMSVDEAVGIIAARVTAVQETETVALVEADGRILARDIAAPLPLPPFTNSAVDGYAVRQRRSAAWSGTGISGDRARSGRRLGGASHQAGPGRADLHRRADAGRRRHRVHAGGRAARGDGKVVLPAGLKPGANVRPAGEDIPVGHVALKAGQRLRPQDVALAAASA